MPSRRFPAFRTGRCGTHRESHGDFGADCGPGVVAFEAEVFVAEGEEVAHGGVEEHAGQGARGARQQQERLLDVVAIQVQVAEGVHELAGPQARHLRHHHAQQGVGGDVEGDAQEAVGRALVELQAQAAVADVELEQGVAWGQVHAVDLAGVPGRDDDAARLGVVADEVEGLGDLVEVAAVGGGPGAPLVAVDVAEVAVGAGPFVPDAHAVLLQVAHVGVAGQEPQQLVDDAPQVHPLGGEQGEAPAEVVAVLVAEHGDCAGAGAVLAHGAVVEDVAEHFLVLAHYSGFLAV